ncbi:MAG: hypothetical protein ISQ67_03525 [Luminiphilus sp.]|nr:hypothetical protein [Luminiphilus sp.]
MTKETDQATRSDVTSSELIGAVKQFLMESVLPSLSGRDQFNARVAANVLGIIEREQQLDPALQALDAEAAQKWLPNLSSDADIPQQLSRALAARGITPDTEFRDYLKARQLLIAGINNPRYASRAVAEARWR